MPPARSRVEITLAFWMATNVEDDPGACIPDFLEDSPALGHAATARRARAFHRFRHEFSRVSILAAVRRTFGRWVERTCPRQTPEFQKKAEEFFSQVENLGIAIPTELKAAQNAKAGLLRVPDRPEVPLHNNALESDIREFVKR